MSLQRRGFLKMAGLGSAAAGAAHSAADAAPRWSHAGQEPIEAAAEQIGQFASLCPNNARPAQGRDRRFPIETN